ncbi:hypothetical protein IQ07DRAFT_476877, partial [Pyrenochaeta sp. DS3sAY3a]
HASGRKYQKATGEELEKIQGHKGIEEKLDASLISRQVWETAQRHEGYIEKKDRFLKEHSRTDQ